jgi:hypothetical protein
MAKDSDSFRSNSTFGCCGETLLLLMLCVFVSGCGLLPMGSGGGSVRTRSTEPERAVGIPSDGPVSFLVIYDNWISFNRDLTATVDSAFARIKSGDSLERASVDDFFRPAQEVLYELYAITLPPPVVKAVPLERKFTFTSGWSAWSSSKDRFPDSLKGLPVAENQSRQYRWRGRIVTASARYDSVTPNRVYIKAEFAVEMEIQSDRSATEPASWSVALMASGASEKFGKLLKHDMQKRYYKYVKEEIGATVESTSFRGYRDE